MSLTPGGPQPTAGVMRTSHDVDAEKNHPVVAHTGSDHSSDNATPSTNEYDIDGEKVQEFQNGVERVRIITSMWSKPTLISMFIL